MLKATAKGAAMLAKWLKGPATGTELGIRVGMDVIPATMNAIATPGDLFDKAVAGATDLALSSTLGLAAGRLGGKNQLASTMLDMAGSYGGAYGAMPVADTIMRGKDKLMGGKGQTPYERLSDEQKKVLEAQITEQVLHAYGLIPQASRYISNPSTGMGVA